MTLSTFRLEKDFSSHFTHFSHFRNGVSVRLNLYDLRNRACNEWKDAIERGNPLETGRFIIREIYRP